MTNETKALLPPKQFVMEKNPEEEIERKKAQYNLYTFFGAAYGALTGSGLGAIIGGVCCASSNPVSCAGTMALAGALGGGLMGGVTTALSGGECVEILNSSTAAIPTSTPNNTR